MPKIKTELEHKDILRLSNEESNRITKECIESALIFLLKEHRFEDITITDIVKRAGVSRTAYYRNYESKEGILRNFMADVVESVINAMFLFDPAKNEYEYWYAMFKTVRKHAEAVMTLFSASFGEMILEAIQDKIQSTIDEHDIFEKYRVSFWYGAAYNILLTWLKNEMQPEEEMMAKMCLEISNMPLAKNATL